MYHHRAYLRYARVVHEAANHRASSLRALAWRDDAGAFEAIQPLLADKDAKVRGAAVRALGILDKARALGLSGVDALRNDPNPHVKRAFRSLARD